MAADAMRVTRRIVAMPALAKYQPRGIPARPRVAERRGAGARRPATSPPPSSTRSAPCKMGSDDTAVVDQRLRVRGLAGPARRRRLRHADHHLRQHQRADPDDRREGGRDDPARSAHERAGGQGHGIVMSAGCLRSRACWSTPTPGLELEPCRTTTRCARADAGRHVAPVRALAAAPCHPGARRRLRCSSSSHAAPSRRHPRWRRSRPPSCASRPSSIPRAAAWRPSGAEREGSGIVIGADGLMLTIGYLMLEAHAAEVVTNDAAQPGGRGGGLRPRNRLWPAQGVGGLEPAAHPARQIARS